MFNQLCINPKAKYEGISKVANMLNLIEDDVLAVQSMVAVLVERHGDKGYQIVRDAMLSVAQGRVAVTLTFEEGDDDG